MVLELESDSSAFSGESPMDFAGIGEGFFYAEPQKTFWVWKNSYARILTWSKYVQPLHREKQCSVPFKTCLEGNLFLKHM